MKRKLFEKINGVPASCTNCTHLEDVTWANKSSSLKTQCKVSLDQTLRYQPELRSIYKSLNLAKLNKIIHQFKTCEKWLPTDREYIVSDLMNNIIHSILRFELNGSNYGKNEKTTI